jgi:hypothetical protein
VTGILMSGTRRVTLTVDNSMRHITLLLAVGIVGCGNPMGSTTEMIDWAEMQRKVTPLMTVDAVGRPGACALPNHTQSNECWAALIAIGAIAPVWYAECKRGRWAKCVSASFALAGAIYAWGSSKDQHGYADPVAEWYEQHVENSKNDNGYIP